MTETPKQVLAKLTKLYALTASTNEHEAALAAEKAINLLAKYGSLKEVDDSAAERKPAQPKRDFTDRFLKAIKPAPAGKRVIYYDGQIPHFALRVTDKSTPEAIGTFILAKPTKRAIGVYPGMSLAKAREIAREWREDIRQGVDPKQKQAECRRKEALRKAGTFAAAFEAFTNDHLATLRSGKAIKAAIERRVMPAWRDLPISDIRRADIHGLLRDVKKAHPIAANRLLAYLKKFFAWAVEQDLLEASPAAAVKMPAKATDRDRVLSDDEIRYFWKACESLGPFGRAFKIMLLSAQRRNEVGKMTWSEIDRKSKTWRLPRDRVKADRAHEIPLPDAAMAIIDECPRIGDFVFSTGRSGRGKQATKGAKTVPISGWGKATAALRKSMTELAAKEAKESGQEPIAVAEFRLHDLRRSCASNLARLHIPPEVTSKILNHSEVGVTKKVYIKHLYEDEKRAALNAWADRLAAIVSGNDDGGANVIQFSDVRGAK